MSTMPQPQEVLVTLGVDTHADTHVVAALDQLGRHLGTTSVATTIGGFELLEWASHFGVIDCVGVEGTGSWGAGLARWLRAQGLVVVEVDRLNRRTRRRHGKSDGVDALAAARAVQSGEALGVPNGADGEVEAIRVLRVAYRSAVKARTQVANQLHALVVTATHELRPSAACASPTSSPSPGGRGPATRPRQPPRSSSTPCGPSRAATPSSTPRSLTSPPRSAGSSIRSPPRSSPSEASARSAPARCSSPPAATPNGCAPRAPSRTCAAPRRSMRPRASSNATGSAAAVTRQAHCALHTIAIVRMSHDETTRKYIARRIAEGKTKREAIRCLKRYIARDIDRILVPIITTGMPLDKT